MFQIMGLKPSFLAVYLKRSGGNVGFASVNIAYKDQIYKDQICSDFNFEDFIIIIIIYENVYFHE